MHKLLVANWKMNPGTEQEAERLARASDHKNVVICPPFPFLEEVGEGLKKAKLGAQDVFWEDQGAYTGEVSASMLKRLGVRYVITGHSERRRYLGETDEMINRKVRAAVKAELKPILCVGEPLAVRKKGLAAAKNFVRTQLRAALRGAPRFALRDLLAVAYEPVWAISTVTSKTSMKNADTPENAVDIIRFIKKVLVSICNLPSASCFVLYGGSVDRQNTRAFLRESDIDGALVGGASVRVAEIAKMIEFLARF